MKKLFLMLSVMTGLFTGMTAYVEAADIEAKLEDAAGASGFNVQDSTGASKVYVKSDGSVGIGTTSPTRQLDIRNNGIANLAIASLDNTTGSYSDFGIIAQDQYINMLVHADARTGTRWGITLGGWSEIRNQNGNGLIVGTSDATPLVFGTNNAEVMRLNSSGNVGIGTTSPSALFHMVGGDAIFENTSSGTGASTSQARIYNRGTGDTALRLSVPTSDWYLGIDQLNSDTLKIGRGSSWDTVPAVSILTGGNVGIGTTSPSVILHIKGSSGSGLRLDTGLTAVAQLQDIATNEGALRLYSGGVENVKIRSNNNSYFNGGNVGIGTTSPEYRLNIVGSDVVTSRMITERTSADTAGPWIETLKSRSGGSANAGDNAGVFAFSIRNSAGNPFHGIAGIRGTVDNATAGAEAGYLTFNVASGGVQNVEKVRLTSDGNLGIGTTAPSKKLDVTGDINLSGGIYVGGVLQSIGGGWTAGTGDDIGRLTGNVGIGTTSPTSLLHVAGNANITGTLTTGAYAPSTLSVSGASYLATTSGNVGIGTTSPGRTLDVNGTAVLGNNHNRVGGNVTIGSTWSADPTIEGTNSDTLANLHIYYNSDGAGYAANTGGGIALGGTYDSHTNVAAYGMIYGMKTDGTDGHYDGYLSFHTSTLGATPYHSEKMRITSGGNVGIGTTAPIYKLDVSNGSVRASNDHAFNVDLDTNQIVASGLADPNMRVYMGYDTTGNYGYIQSHWRTHGWTPLVLQPSSGNVGIGTTSPGAKLEIYSLTSPAMRLSQGGAGFQLNTVSAGADTRMDLSYYSSGVFYKNLLTANFNGNVGIGTTGPLAKLDVTVAGSSGVITTAATFGLPNNPGGAHTGTAIELRWRELTGESVKIAGYHNGTGATMGFYTGSTPVENMTINHLGNVGIGTTNPLGKLDVNGTIFQRGTSLHADYVFEPAYKLESIDDHSAYMWQNKHLKAVPKAAKDEEGQEIVNWGERSRGVLEELEKAHVYIQQLNERIKTLEARLDELERK